MYNFVKFYLLGVIGTLVVGVVQVVLKHEQERVAGIVMVFQVAIFQNPGGAILEAAQVIYFKKNNDV